MTPAMVPTPDPRPILGTADPRAVSTKVIEVNGELHLVSVMAPGPEEHDERTWPLPNPTLSCNYPSYIYHGSSLNPDEDEETPAEHRERHERRNAKV